MLELKRPGQALVGKSGVGQVTLNLHEDGLILCEGGLGVCHPLS